MSCAEHADNPQPAWCLECMETTPPPPKAPEQPWERTSGTTTAAFTTTCIGCDEPVNQGDRIRLWSSAWDRQAWLHDRPSCTPPTIPRS